MSKENNCKNMESVHTETSQSSIEEKSECNKETAETTESPVLDAAIVDKVNQLNISNCAIEQSVKTPGMVIKNSENQSLNRILTYDSDSSSSSEMEMLGRKWPIRCNDDSESETSSDSSSEEESDDSSSEEEECPKPAPSNGAIKKDKSPKSAIDGNEVGMETLPPVPDLSTLSLNVDNESFVHMGSIFGIVEKLVTIEALPNLPAYDLETLLFLENGKKPLGFVFDVLGQVTSPIYAVRFNSPEDIKSLNINVGDKVYSAPSSKHTQYVFLQQLLNMKGTDASWLGDNEVPTEFADYSDDDNEYFDGTGTTRVQTHLKRAHCDEHHKKFENTMNKRNLLNTKFNKYMDSYKQTRLQNKSKARRPVAPQIGNSVPVFDPSVPPPNLRPLCAPSMEMWQFQDYYQYDPRLVGGQNNNSAATGMGYSTQTPPVLMNNFVANLSQIHSANYHTNHAGNPPHPGTSQQ